MELHAHAVAAHFPDDGIAVLPGQAVHRFAHVADGLPGLYFFQSGLNTLAGDFHQLLLFRRGLPDDEHPGGVGIVAVQNGGAVYIDDVALAENVLRGRNAVADLLVDGGADALGEALVIQRRGDGPGLRGLLIDPAVDLLSGNAGADVLRYIVQHGDVHLGAAADLLDLGFVFDQPPGRQVNAGMAQGFVFFVKGAMAILICFSAAAPARGAGFQFFHQKFLLMISIHALISTNDCGKSQFSPVYRTGYG